MTKQFTNMNLKYKPYHSDICRQKEYAITICDVLEKYQTDIGLIVLNLDVSLIFIIFHKVKEVATQNGYIPASINLR
ncbi:Hypothetical predicted protein [Octopus vulgaris]|uniref:Uncharacterized protein n=1 Tax=Octopus vulgaris TaxID=6645 RepID=A0AA36BPM5_OCTVU|nr:Hypothetical predicted protein [Octopus vulgaris]